MTSGFWPEFLLQDYDSVGPLPAPLPRTLLEDTHEPIVYGTVRYSYSVALATKDY